MGRPTSYEEALAQHRWEVPERYNIAADVCDKHPADKLAMIHEDFRGSVREVSWGELQAASNRFAHVLRAHGVEKGDRVAMLLPPTPETAAAFFATFKCGAILLSMSVLYGDEGIRHRVSDSGAKVLVTDRANADRVDPALVQDVLLIEDFPSEGDDRFEAEDTLADDPAQLYYSSGTTGLAKGILHAHRYLLAHEEFVYCHDVQDGELFHGMGEWAWAAGIAPLFGPWRYGAVQLVYQREGGFDPHKQLDVLSRHGATNVFTTPTAMRSMMGITDAASRYPQRFRVVCSAGEPLNPEAIRWFREQYGLTVLDYYGLTESYPLVANYPFMDVREGSMGRPMPGWEVAILDEDERPVPQGERGEICLRARIEPALPARLLEQRGGERRDVRRRLVPHEGRRPLRRRRLRLVRGPRGRRDHRRGLPDRPVRGRVRVPRAPGGGRGGGGRGPGRAARQRRQGVHRGRRGGRAVRRGGGRDQGVRPRPPGRPRLPAPDRVHRRPAEDADRQDPPDRAAPAGAGQAERLAVI